MKVVVVEPYKSAYEQEIDPNLKSLQNAVGGLIEVVYPFSDNVGIICNDEAKLHNLPPNRILYDEETGMPYDIICGTFLVVGLTEEDFGSLTKKQIETYLEMYSKVPNMQQEFVQRYMALFI